MQLLASITTVALAASQVAAGRYWVTAGHITGFGGPVGETGNHWVFTPDIKCDTLNHANIFPSKSDVSGNKKGVRVAWQKDKKCGDDFFGHQCPHVVEMHNNRFHRTWYANRNNAMVNLEGKVVGHCEIRMGHDFQCDVTAGVTRYQTLLHCTEN